MTSPNTFAKLLVLWFNYSYFFKNTQSAQGKIAIEREYISRIEARIEEYIKLG